jgi:hypothetical protein
VFRVIVRGERPRPRAATLRRLTPDRTTSVLHSAMEAPNTATREPTTIDIRGPEAFQRFLDVVA